MLRYFEQRVAVFIDTQNMYYSARNIFGRKVSFGSIVEDVVGDRQLIRATAYVVSTKGGEESAFFEALKKTGIDTKEKILMEYMTGIKKADWDVGIAVDVISMIDMVDVVILVSGDGDFIPLAQYVKSRGRKFEVASFRETTSSQLLEHVDAYVNLSENKRKFLLGASKRPPTRMTKGGEAFVEMDQANHVPERVLGAFQNGGVAKEHKEEVESTSSDDDGSVRRRRIAY